MRHYYNRRALPLHFIHDQRLQPLDDIPKGLAAGQPCRVGRHHELAPRSRAHLVVCLGKRAPVALTRIHHIQRSRLFVLPPRQHRARLARHGARARVDMRGVRVAGLLQDRVRVHEHQLF